LTDTSATHLAYSVDNRLPCTQLIEPVTIFVTAGHNCATLV